MHNHDSVPRVLLGGRYMHLGDGARFCRCTRGVLCFISCCALSRLCGRFKFNRFRYAGMLRTESAVCGLLCVCVSVFSPIRGERTRPYNPPLHMPGGVHMVKYVKL